MWLSTWFQEEAAYCTGIHEATDLDLVFQESNYEVNRIVLQKFALRKLFE